MSTYIDDDTTPAEIRKLRFDFAKHLATMNTANILALNFLIGISVDRGPTQGAMLCGGLAGLCLPISLGLSVFTMKACADGEHPEEINHAYPFWAMVTGMILMAGVVVFSGQTE